MVNIAAYGSGHSIQEKTSEINPLISLILYYNSDRDIYCNSTPRSFQEIGMKASKKSTDRQETNQNANPSKDIDPAAASGVIAWLEVMSGEKNSQRVSINDLLSIGRVEENDLCLPELEVSRRHATIERQGDEYTITDQGSANGTFINGIQITQPVRLKNGDVVSFGGCRTRFLTQSKPGHAAAFARNEPPD
jgi:hypothetical protein